MHVILSASSSPYTMIAVALAIAFVLSMAYNFFQRRQPKDDSVGNKPWPLGVNQNFLTPAEQSFLASLKTFAGEQYVICPKVRLSDVVFVRKGTGAKERQTILNRINRKHIDFLLLSTSTLQPVLAIELDDSSHQNASSRARDLVKDKALADAGLKVVRVPARSAYSAADFETIINVKQSDSLTASMPESAKPESSLSIIESSTPICPKCQAPMVLRKSTKGAKAGQSFYGCANYPNCREIIPLDEQT